MRAFGGALLVLALASLALRIAIIAGSQHALGSNVHAGFDESVYVGASWLFRAGHLPYRDFVYVFPPGFLALLWPITALTAHLGGPSATVTAARLAAAAAGSVSVWLVGQLGRRWLGWPAGLLAAAIFATTPAVVGSDTLVLQEPFVNLAVLLAFTVWMRHRAPTRRALYLAAVLVGIAISIKLVAALFLVPLLIVGPFVRPVGDRIRFAVVAFAPLAVLGGLIAVFVGWWAPFEQAVLAQLTRPDSGEAVSRVDSLLGVLRGQTWGARPLASLPITVAVVACTALTVGVLASRTREGTLWGSSALVVGGFLLISPSYFVHYAALLAPALALMLAWAASRLARLLSGPGSRRATVAVLVVGVVVAGSQLVTAYDGRRHDTGAVDAGLIRAVRAPDCIVAIRPQILIDANRVPSADRDGRVLLDVYGTALVGHRHESTGAGAFDASHSPATQREIRRQARDCGHILMSARSCHKGAKDVTARTAAVLEQDATVVARAGCLRVLTEATRASSAAP